MDLVIGPLDLSAHVDEALAVQAVAFGLGPDEVAVRRQIVLRHMTYPGARALGATAGRNLVGFVYGMPNDRHPAGGPRSWSRTSGRTTTTTGSTTPS
ncbi:hypothetical protein SVIOM74S_10084 [Streptomyces violarus]